MENNNTNHFANFVKYMSGRTLPAQQARIFYVEYCANNNIPQQDMAIQYDGQFTEACQKHGAATILKDNKKIFIFPQSSQTVADEQIISNTTDIKPVVPEYNLPEPYDGPGLIIDFTQPRTTPNKFTGGTCQTFRYKIKIHRKLDNGEFEIILSKPYTLVMTPRTELGKLASEVTGIKIDMDYCKEFTVKKLVGKKVHVILKLEELEGRQVPATYIKNASGLLNNNNI